MLEAGHAEKKRLGLLVDDRVVVETVLEKMMDDKFMYVVCQLWQRWLGSHDRGARPSKRVPLDSVLEKQ